MKKNYSLIPLTFLLTLQGLLTAQNTKGNNELDNKYSPSENSIFNSLHKKRNNSNSVAEAIDLENAVNFTPTMLLRRKIFFNYERKVGDDFVVSLGLGKALGGDFFQEGGDLSVIDEDPDIRNTFVAYQIYSHSTYSGSSPLLFAGVNLSIGS